MKNKMIDIDWRMKKTYYQGYFHKMMTARVVNKSATSSCGLYYIVLNKSENATPVATPNELCITIHVSWPLSKGETRTFF